MSGLMTGRWGRPAPPSRPSPIAPALLAVVENALSTAWRVLLEDVAAGRFSICDALEDEITEQLQQILGELHAAEPEVVPGYATFSLSRESKLRDFAGKHLDRQPDLTFYPLRGVIPTTNSSLAGIFVECKPIDSGHPIQSVYCKEGLIRFIQGDYAWAVDHGLMVGYVRNHCHLPSGLTPCSDDEQTRKQYRFEGSLVARTPTSAGDAVYQSTHSRSFSLSTWLPVGSINLHHLWLQLSEPCEKSRCRT
jgi:hypothetical protein